MSLRGRCAAVAILKLKAGHPVAKHGSGKQDGSPITKNMRFAASFRFLFLYFRVLFRSVQPYFVTGCRFVPFKIAASLSLLAMTNLVGFAEKRNNFRNEKVSITAELHCAASASAVPAGASTSGLSSAVLSVSSFVEAEVSASGGASRRRGRPSASKISS